MGVGIMSQLFNVVLGRHIGGFVILQHRNRTCWTKRTALKHAKDMKRSGQYLSVGITPNDHSAPVVEV